MLLLMLAKRYIGGSDGKMFYIKVNYLKNRMFVFISIVRIYDAIRYHDMICDAIKRNDMYYI